MSFAKRLLGAPAIASSPRSEQADAPHGSAAPSASAGRLGEATAYTVTMYGVRAVAIAKGVFLASLLGPSSYGIVAAFTAFLAYTQYFDFGLVHGQYREVPILRGGGRHAEARTVASATYGGALALGAAAFVVLAILALLQRASLVVGSWWFGLSLAFAVAGQQLAAFPNTLAYAERRFGLLARGLCAAAVIDLVATILAGLRWGAVGAIAVAPITFFVQFALLFQGLERPLPPSFSWKVWQRLALIGIPIELIWAANANMITVDKIVALVGLGQRSLGLYALAAAAGTLIMVGPTAIAVQFTPRILEKIGASPKGSGALETMARGLDILVLIAAPVVAASIVLLPALTRALLPAYVPAVQAAQILVVASALLASGIPFVSYVVGRGRQWLVVWLYLGNAIFNIGLDVLLLRAGAGITGIAIGSLTSYALLAIAMRMLVLRLATGQGRRFALRLALPLAPIAWGAGVGVAVATSLAALGSTQDLGPSIIGACCAIFLVGPAAAVYARHTGVIPVRR